MTPFPADANTEQNSDSGHSDSACGDAPETPLVHEDEIAEASVVASPTVGSVIDRPELVFGLVGALGTDLDQVEQELQSALRTVGYQSNTVRVSRLIAEEYSKSHDVMTSSQPAMAQLMDAGDELRQAAGLNAAVALGISRLLAQRLSINPDGTERAGHATILRSIKRKEEVATLREVYGSRFVLIGGWATRDDRKSEVERGLRAEHPDHDTGWYAQQTALLMERDEADAKQEFGQAVRDAFELADVYVAVRSGHAVGPRIGRVVRLLFGAPFETPTRHEEAMFLASGAGLRSSAAGRQVGAVVVDDDGEVVVTGTNEAPRAFGGQYWAGEAPDHRDFTYGHDVNDRLKLQVVADVLARLNSEGWLSPKAGVTDPDSLARRAMSGPLRGSRIADLLEFGRIAHAEMAAISTAARRGTPLRGTTMYSTTYPCHECARLIIAAGIRKVVYIDPYPKSQVQEMFRDEVSEGPCARQDTVVFEPFEGVAPRLFSQVFRMRERPRNRVTGQYNSWDGTSSTPLLLTDGATPSPIPMEHLIIQDLVSGLQAHGWRNVERD